MAKQPTKPDTRKTATEVKKEISGDDLSMVRAIARLFSEMAKANPQAVIDVMVARGTHFATLTPEQLANQVLFYIDAADSLIERFDHK